MNSTKAHFLVTIGLLFIATMGSALPVNATPVPIGNSSFETPEITGFEYVPLGASWSFTMPAIGGGAGISHPPSGFGGTPAPDGNQYAFLQLTGSFFQSIAFPADGTYVLTFFAAGRTDNGFGARGDQTYRVLLDSAVIFAGSTTSSSAFNAQQSAPFLATGGAHTLTFEGLKDFVTFGDQTAFIDAIAINSLVVPTPSPSVPEPSALLLLSLGVAGLAAIRRRRFITG